MIKQVEEEIKHGISNGHISFDDFSYMYMFLEFNDKKKHKDKRAQSQSSEITEDLTEDLNMSLLEKKSVKDLVDSSDSEEEIQKLAEQSGRKTISKKTGSVDNCVLKMKTKFNSSKCGMKYNSCGDKISKSFFIRGIVSWYKG